MLLTAVQEIREELGFDDMPDINLAIRMALNSAESLIAATLRTPLGRESVTDTFFVERPSYRSGGLRRTEFRLSRGFLVAPPTTDKGSFTFDLEKGIARDLSTDYFREPVTFSYQAGFEADSGNPGSYVLSQVPPWLQEAAKLKALLLIAKHPSITEAGIDLDAKLLDQQYASLINTHIRYAPLALLPE